MKFYSESVSDWEIVHLYDTQGGDSIFSKGAKFQATIAGECHSFSLPESRLEKAISGLRILRRLLRTDKSNCVLNQTKDGLAIIKNKKLYFYDLSTKSLSLTGHLRQSRNVLHQGFCVTDKGIYFGEYGANKAREPVPIWRSLDGGRSWQIAHQLSDPAIKHIHGIYKDKYSDSLWITTGDFPGECFLYEAPGEDFSRIERHGDGSQPWRAVSLIFQRDSICWAMDSQLQTSTLVVFDRVSGDIVQGQAFPGPVWHCKDLQGCYLLQSSVEIGPASTSRFAHLYFSEDLRNWTCIAKFKKDRWPMRFFKFGVLSFADGLQSRDEFYLFGEGLKGLDGKIIKCRLESIA